MEEATPVKTNSIDPSSITFEQDLYKEDQLREKMLLLLQLPGNNACVECSEAGIHRNLGVHISRVKSLFLDNWKREELESMRDNGNLKSKQTWENNLPRHFIKPTQYDSVPLKEQHIRAKYERKEYSQSSKHENYSLTKKKEGFLTKKGSVVKNWKKRWFVLTGTVLSYFKKPKDPFPAGVILIKDAKSIDCVAEPIDNKAYCFVISTPGRDYFATADSGKDMFDWVMLLRIAKAVYCPNNPTDKSASECDIKQVATKLSTEISIQKRKLNSKTFLNCFVGIEAVDWMVEKLGLKSRNEAIDLGKKLLTEGFIQSVTNGEPFNDDYCFYQFLKTE